MNDGFGIFNVLWLIILLAFLFPFLQRRILTARRLRLIQSLGRSRKSRIITLIHRQERVSLFGITLRRFIDMEDSQHVLRAIRKTPPDTPIDLILHTPGGIVLASEQIASALKRHEARVRVLIPHYAMSGGTLVALAADEIVMDAHAVLGPVDPQLGSWRSGFYPAASILEAASRENPNRDDQTLILADIARKAVSQVHRMIEDLIGDRMSEERAGEIAATLSEGRFTHDYPIGVDMARAIGLPVTEGLPDGVHELMRLFPQGVRRRPSVEYVHAVLPSRRRPEE